MTIHTKARSRVGFVQVQNRGVGNKPSLNNLRRARHQLILWQRPQPIQINKHGIRLVERPHQVLPRRSVNTRLTPHSGIHHGQQRGGHLNNLDTAHPGRSDKTCKIRGGAATKTNHHIAAAKVLLPQHIPTTACDLQSLAIFSVGQLNQRRLQARSRHGIGEGVRSVDKCWLVDKRNLCGAGSCGGGAGDGLVKPVVNDYLIGVRSGDVDGGHAPSFHRRWKTQLMVSR